MYSQDSFFDLSPWGQVGLLCISTVLCLATVFGSIYLLRRQRLLVRLSGALMLFWVFVWASPQIYYQYYILIIPDLPWQWVIWPPASPRDAFELLFFQGPQNLSAHSQGLLGWSLLGAQVTLFFRSRRTQGD
ncbi:MAG: hypothetical protein AAF666_08065 [Pseudomonadota bacterium]